MAHILAAALTFDEDLVYELKIKGFSDAEDILLSERMIGVAYIDPLLKVANVELHVWQ